MEKLLVYHNPVCSKSRGALDILHERGVDHDVVEYLKAPPDRATLERILDSIPDPPAELVRKDKRFDELGLRPGDHETREQVITLLLEHPELMQRPVVFLGDRAVIARPSEKVLELLD
jgi:arsenate reductase